MHQYENKRGQILAATLETICEYGLQDTPVSQITKRAGVGAGTIYNYFSSKEVLINTLYQELKDGLSDLVLLDYDETAPIRERFFILWRKVVDCYLKYPKEAVFIEQYAYSPYISEEAKQSGCELEQKIVQLYEEAVAMQVIKDYPPYFSVHMTYGSLTMLIKGHLAGDLSLDETALDEAISCCWDALKL